VEAPPAIVTPARDPRREVRYFRLRGALVFSMPLDRRTVPLGGAIEIQGLAQFRLGGPISLGAGLELRYLDNAVAGHVTFGIPISVFMALTDRIELDLAVVPQFTWIGFASHFVEDATAFGLRAELGFAYRLTSRLALGVTPLAFSYLGDEAVGSIASWEPRAWVGLSL
jgi:hypothetical protein